MAKEKDALKMAAPVAQKDRVTRIFRGVMMVEPVLPLMFLAAFPVFADVFGANPQTLGQGFIEFVRYSKNWVYVLGVLGVFWTVANGMMGKPWGGKLIASIACFAAPSLIELFYQFSQGRAVNFDTTLTN